LPGNGHCQLSISKASTVLVDFPVDPMVDHRFLHSNMSISWHFVAFDGPLIVLSGERYDTPMIQPFKHQLRGSSWSCHQLRITRRGWLSWLSWWSLFLRFCQVQWNSFLDTLRKSSSHQQWKVIGGIASS